MVRGHFRCLGLDLHAWALLLAAVATGVAVWSSVVLIIRHLKLNKHSSLRRLTIRILLMVPVYSVEAFVALAVRVTYPVTVEMLQFFREFYEAIVIISFLQFILVCVGGHQAAMHRRGPSPRVLSVNAQECTTTVDGEQQIQNTEAHVNNTTPIEGELQHNLYHVWPLNLCVRPWGSMRGMTKWCIRGALLYVVVGVVSALVGLSEWLYNWTAGTLENQPSLLLEVSDWVISIAQTFAIMALCELAHGLMDQLSGLKPLGKFLSVKLIVFFTFWQGLLIDWLCHNTSLFQALADESFLYDTPEELAAAYKNFLLCVEMAFFAVAHFYVFPPDDFEIVLASRGVYLPSDVVGSCRKPPVRDILEIGFNFRDVANVRDIWRVAWDAGVPKKEHWCPKGFARKDASTTAGTLGETATQV